jgi:hypothetical protein
MVHFHLATIWTFTEGRGVNFVVGPALVAARSRISVRWIWHSTSKTFCFRGILADFGSSRSGIAFPLLIFFGSQTLA